MDGGASAALSRGPRGRAGFPKAGGETGCGAASLGAAGEPGLHRPLLGPRNGIAMTALLILGGFLALIFVMNVVNFRRLD